MQSVSAVGASVLWLAEGARCPGGVAATLGSRKEANTGERREAVQEGGRLKRIEA